MKDPGVETERVVTMEMSLARATYGGTPERQRFMRQVLERLESDPAIEAVGLTDELPLRGTSTAFFAVESGGASPGPVEEPVNAQQMRITSDYFRAMGIPVKRGRSLSPAAEGPQGPREIVINEELAMTFWPGAEGVGEQLVLPGISDPFTVVGIVGNVNAIRIDDEPQPQIYLPLLRGGTRYLTLVARGRLSERDLIGKMREAVQTASPGQAVYNVKTMEDVIADTIAPRRINTVLITLFGVLAVVLAAIGVYGVIAHAVARRQREIGVRLALGAHPRRVVGAVLREGLQLTLLGSLLGLGGAWMLTQLMAGLVYGVAPRDPVAFLTSTIVLIGVATLATLLPALRAASVDPAAIMKAD
jgi:predicted permease